MQVQMQTPRPIGILYVRTDFKEYSKLYCPRSCQEAVNKLKRNKNCAVCMWVDI